MGVLRQARSGIVVKHAARRSHSFYYCSKKNSSNDCSRGRCPGEALTAIQGCTGGARGRRMGGSTTELEQSASPLFAPLLSPLSRGAASGNS